MNPSRAEKILLVDDNKSSRESTRLFLEDAGFEVVEAANGMEALEHLADGISAVITDLDMPGMDGMDVLRAVQEKAPHAPVIVLTGHGSEAAAVQALKSGAFHYITKPANPDELANLLRQACEKSRMTGEIAALHRELTEQYGFANILGRSDPMRRVFEKIRMVADTQSTVVIEGDSGTGKELVARALHYNGARAGKPFVVINCAAMPEALVESELFGHAKGAFTGASDRRVGKFQAADGGSLLIDEVGEMPLHLQSKFLRSIESRCVTPVGSNQEIEVDVRIIAATNRQLQGLVSDGEFRDDLFYRLNVVSIRLPPLRERREDIPILVRAFIKELAAENERPVRDISPEALSQLQGYDWPGNVRQLRNVLENVVVTTMGEVIEPQHLPDPVRAAHPSPLTAAIAKHGLRLDQLEKEAIRLALEKTNGNRSQASEILGISVRTLQRKIHEYGL